MDKLLEELREYCQYKTKNYFTSSSCDITFETHLLNVRHDHLVLHNCIPFSMIETVMRGEKYSLQCGRHRLVTPHILAGGVDIVFPLEEASVVDETRHSKRFGFNLNETVICKFLNPVDLETQLQYEVLDMSAHGVSISSPQPSRILQPGVKLGSFSIYVNDKSYHKQHAEVVYSRKIMDENQKLKIQAGIKFE